MGIKRKSHFKGSQEAVSEIIGTLLILAITVILFSTVLFYVAQIPPPHQNTNVDFGTEPIIQHSNGTKHGHMGKCHHERGPDPLRWHHKYCPYS